MQFFALCFDLHCYKILRVEISISSIFTNALYCKKDRKEEHRKEDVLGSSQESRNHYKYLLNYTKGISLRKLVILMRYKLRRQTGEASITQRFSNSRKP